MENQNTLRKFTQSRTLKACTILVLTLILFGVSQLVKDIIEERKYNKENIETEIMDKWGANQTIVSPLIQLPYNLLEINKNGKKEWKRYYDYIPISKSNYTIDIQMNPLERSIYKVNSYIADITLNGVIEANTVNTSLKNYELEKAQLFISISDAEKIAEPFNTKINQQTVAFTSISYFENNIQKGFLIPLNYDNITPQEISMQLKIKGTNEINIVPLSKQNTVKVASKWKDPKFDGFELPKNRTVDTNGFSAEWNIQDYTNTRNYNIGNQHYDELTSKTITVELIELNDEYQKNTRAIKYILMTICLTFLAFFVSEVMYKIRIHPIQYFLIGIGLVIFHVLLISLSEHLGFNNSYLIAMATIVGLTSYYASFVMQKRNHAFVIGGLITTIYGFIFTTLQLQEYALVFGSIGLVITLALTMYVTRKINWYE